MANIDYIRKRNELKVKVEPGKIRIALKKAFLESEIIDEKLFDDLTNQVVNIIEKKVFSENIPTVEQIQDIVKEVLIKNNYSKIAKSYILYREKHKQIRKKITLEKIKEHKLKIKNREGREELFDLNKLRMELQKISADF